jgi:hypothetical protein
MRNGSLAIGSMLALTVTACFSPPSDSPLLTTTADLVTVTGELTDTGDSATSSASTTGETPDPSTGPDPDPDTTGSLDGTSTGEASTGDPSTSDGSTGPAGDADGDGIADDVDNCPEVVNVDQGDLDGDDVGNFCDTEIIDDAELLYVPVGAEHSMVGSHCYSSEVRIYGTVEVVPQGAMAGSGTLVIASEVAIYVADTGVIDGVGRGFAGGLAAPIDGGMAGTGPRFGCGGGPGSSVANGGSGGGYGGAGGTADPNTPYAMMQCTLCSQATEAHCHGAAGGTVGTDTGTDLSMGSGGGAGGNSSGCTDSGGDGARGGGMVSLVANERVRIDGTVGVDGGVPVPDDSACGYRPGGGGGSGGGLLVAADTVEGGPGGLLSARGGNGGQALGDTSSTWGWAGGGGGGGRVKVFAPTNDFMGAVEAGGGVGGMFPADRNSYGGIAGQAGTAAAMPMIPAALDNVTCN